MDKNRLAAGFGENDLMLGKVMKTAQSSQVMATLQKSNQQTIISQLLSSQVTLFHILSVEYSSRDIIAIVLMRWI